MLASLTRDNEEQETPPWPVCHNLKHMTTGFGAGVLGQVCGCSIHCPAQLQTVSAVAGTV